MTTINPTIIDSNLNPNQQQVVQQPAQPQQPVQQPIQPVPPQTYIVQAGDNLSTIAQRYGVNVANITGFRSGNPNLIYPGEQLTINKPIQQQPVQQQGQQPTQQPVQQQQPEPDMDDEFAGYRQAEQNLQGLLNQYNARFTSDDFFSNPQKTVQDLISQVMTTMNVPSITESMSNLSKEIESLTNEMNDEIAKINNNPWLIESQRVQQIRNAQDKYENKINAKVSRLSLEEGMLQNARQQAQYITTTALNMYDKERIFQMEGLENMIKRAENELNFQAKLIEDARKPNEEKLDVFTDASGDRIVTFYNKKTGETRQVSLSGTTQKLDTSIIPSSKPQGLPEIISFEEFLKEAQQKAQASFAPKMVENLRRLYDEEVAKITAESINVRVASLSPLARQIYENPKLLAQLTATEKTTILKEIANAGLSMPVASPVSNNDTDDNPY